MIEYIEGKLTDKNPAAAVIDVQGLGYYIHITLYTFGEISSSEKVKLYIHPVYREDAQILYGFSSQDERTVFRSLISVNGVGPNTARVILSSLTYNEALLAISQGNVSAFKKIKGIGEKTAQRILVDLSGKMGKLTDSGSVFSGSPVRNEAFSALVTLGFDKSTVEKTVDKLLSENNNLTVEQLIKTALKNM